MGQIPNPEVVINRATTVSWEAGALAFLIVALIGFFVYVLRRVLDDSKERESRLAERVTNLENEIRAELFAQLRTSTEVMSKVVIAADKMCTAADTIVEMMEKYSTVLSARPCLMAMVDHGKFLSAIETMYNEYVAKETHP